MKLYLSHGAGNGPGDPNPDWFIVEPRDEPMAQVRSLRLAGRAVYEINARPWQGRVLPGLEDQAAAAGVPGMAAIRAYMTAKGWKPDPPGKIGELWRLDSYPHAIGVMFEGEPGSLECRSAIQRLGVIQRLARAEQRPETELRADIMTAGDTLP